MDIFISSFACLLLYITCPLLQYTSRDYTLKGLAYINREGIDAIREALKELEKARYIVRSRKRDSKGFLRGTEYVIYEQPYSENTLYLPESENPRLDNPRLDNPTLDNPTQINNEEQITNKSSIYQTNLLTNERRSVKERIKENIEYDTIVFGCNPEQLNEIVNIITEAVCSSSPTIKINKERIPQQAVKERLLSLNSEHIEYVFNCLEDITEPISNIRSYLLTILYNASSCMDNYYTALYNAHHGKE